jgi:hypothetical protein
VAIALVPGFLAAHLFALALGSSAGVDWRAGGPRFSSGTA